MPGKHADAEPLPDEVRQKLSEIGHVIPADAVLGCWPERNVTAEQKECLEKYFALAYFSGRRHYLCLSCPRRCSQAGIARLMEHMCFPKFLKAGRKVEVMSLDIFW